MCEHITFPVKVLWIMCDSQCWGSLQWLSSSSDSHFFFQPQRQTKTSLMKWNMLSWETPLLSNCFCFSSSNISCNHFGMRFIWWWFGAVFFQTTILKRFLLICRFQTPVVKNIKRTNVIYLRVKNSCCFMNLVWLCGTFRVALWSVEIQSVSSCWTHEILKKLFVISR